MKCEACEQGDHFNCGMQTWCECDCAGPESIEFDTHEPPSLFLHVTPRPEACSHDFTGWRNFEDGSGGEQICSKCGMGAMSYSLHTGF